jgi:hypothetical protein
MSDRSARAYLCQLSSPALPTGASVCSSGTAEGTAPRLFFYTLLCRGWSIKHGSCSGLILERSRRAGTGRPCLLQQLRPANQRQRDDRFSSLRACAAANLSSTLKPRRRSSATKGGAGTMLSTPPAPRGVSPRTIISATIAAIHLSDSGDP